MKHSRTLKYDVKIFQKIKIEPKKGGVINRENYNFIELYTRILLLLYCECDSQT